MRVFIYSLLILGTVIDQSLSASSWIHLTEKLCYSFFQAKLNNVEKWNSGTGFYSHYKHQDVDADAFSWQVPNRIKLTTWISFLAIFHLCFKMLMIDGNTVTIQPGCTNAKIDWLTAIFNTNSEKIQTFTTGLYFISVA